MFPPEVFELGVEKLFSLRAYELELENMSLDQMRTNFLNLLPQMLVKDQIIQHLIGCEMVSGYSPEPVGPISTDEALLKLQDVADRIQCQGDPRGVLIVSMLDTLEQTINDPLLLVYHLRLLKGFQERIDGDKLVGEFLQKLAEESDGAEI